ncbi:response regulator (plasmid) [Fibrella sp. ES10-3-2-2]
MTESPIIFIDSDEDDQQTFIQALAELNSPHPPLVFSDGQAALDYITSSKIVPFIILSDIVLDRLGGLQLREQIEKSPALRKKSIPFIFFTYPVHEDLVERAYEYTIQGLFEKKVRYQEWVVQLREILAYWSSCHHPKQFNKA